MLAELLDLLTPFAMIFLVYKLYRILAKDSAEHPDARVKSSAIIILIFGGICFVEGHGMHLAANAITRHLSELHNTPLFALTYFFDEILGHILWDSGIIFLSIGIILVGSKMNQNSILVQKPVLIILAALLYGFTYFVNAIEGQTVVFTFPVAMLMLIAILWLTRLRGIRLAKNPVLSFFMCAYLVAVCLFLIWLIWQKGFPQFSELGWI